MEHFAISSLSPDIECETPTTYECEITGNKETELQHGQMGQYINQFHDS